MQLTYPEAFLKDAQATEKPSTLKKEHPALQNMNILSVFIFLRVIFAFLNPDPGTHINADPCGSTNLLKSSF